MKKGLLIFLSALSIFSLGGCASTVGDNGTSTMYIEEAKLLEETRGEQSQELDSNQKVYDFFVDGSVQNIHIDVYRLQDGRWERESGSEQTLQDTEGRVIVDLGNLAEELSVAIQEADVSTSIACEADLNSEDMSSMGRMTSTLSEKTDITYGQEIPLVVQIITSKDEIISYDVEYFAHPEEYEKFGYECVQAITVTFNQE